MVFPLINSVVPGRWTDLRGKWTNSCTHCVESFMGLRGNYHDYQSMQQL